MKLLFILFSIVNCNHIAKNNKGKSSVVCTKYYFKVVNYSLQSNAINFNILIELSKPYQIPRDFLLVISLVAATSLYSALSCNAFLINW